MSLNDLKRKLSESEEDEEGDAPVAKKPVPPDGGIGWNLMKKMGYQKGKGLGAEKQGRVEPVQLSTQRGRRGLGLTVPGFDQHTALADWDPSKEKITVEEIVSWLPSCSKSPPTADDLQGWLQMGSKKLTIDDETRYCSEDILSAMLKAKNVFDHLSDRELHGARTRANPFETIKGVFFQNRAAMKMANMDAVFDFMLTNPKNDEGNPLWNRENDELFYFADVCAGPGGFTEYILWRLGWRSHGFGFTLKGECDFKLDSFLASSPEMFETHYGKSGTEGTGDVTDPQNLKAFRDHVHTVTEGSGVHLFMADGGFSVAGQENIQEILSKRIYLCQFLCGISILAEGGNFVCKLFDLFTPFSAGLVYLMWRVFDHVSLHKPHSSRPANSERYLVCKGFRRSAATPVHDHLFEANQRLQNLPQDSGEDVTSVVPLEEIESEDDFLTYLINSNESFAERQRLYLEKYKAFAQNSALYDAGQTDLRWDKLDAVQLHIPRGTLIYGELTREYFDVDGVEQFKNVVNIVDALFLNGQDVSTLPYPRSFKPITIKNVEKIGFHLSSRSSGSMLLKGDIRIPARGLYLVPLVTAPWTVTWSRSGQRVYYFNTKSGVSVFELKDEAGLASRKMFQERLAQFWTWPPKNTKAILSEQHESQLTLADFCGQIDRLKPGRKE